MVGMYHDALQSNFKAFGFDRGVTVQGGLPAPITTIAHSTAFDIAGKNQANLIAMTEWLYGHLYIVIVQLSPLALSFISPSTHRGNSNKSVVPNLT